MNGRLQQLAAAFGLTAILLGAASCGDAVREGRSPAFLVIDGLTGASGATPSAFSGTLAADVLTKGGYLEDLGHAQMRILLKDQGTPGAVSEPSVLNAITLNRYHVAYRRADGRNVQGVDVPYAFDGAITATVTPSSVEVTFAIVRIQAKLEPPLLALARLGGSIAILTIADVTFYGRDQAGNEVSQTGSISINFADWVDPT
jgi:hypothetical protein